MRNCQIKSWLIHLKNLKAPIQTHFLKHYLSTNHNYPSFMVFHLKLYLIEFYIKPQREPLDPRRNCCCILLNFYIKPQLEHVARANAMCCILLNFYIKPQPWAVQYIWPIGCILLNFYIKPQPGVGNWLGRRRCILLNFYIKPQRGSATSGWRNSCILLNFYIKPQLHLLARGVDRCCILLNFYIKPQPFLSCLWSLKVVSYWISTSNHNYKYKFCYICMLYLIEFLHQTTTFPENTYIRIRCILLNFYIKPQHRRAVKQMLQSCILLNFYIKPQQQYGNSVYYRVVSYWISTSNHNFSFPRQG